MKYIIVLSDGMADEPIEQLGHKTPMEYAKTPHFDRLCERGEVGLVHTIPTGMSPGSDTANLAVLGYNPRQHYTGRSPLEAISIGVDMKDTDVCFRVNLVTLAGDGEYEQLTMIDHSSSEIETEIAKQLLEVVRQEFEDSIKKFYAGVSYRHALIWDHGSTEVKLTPPHNILEKTVGVYLPTGQNADLIKKMMKRSYQLLKDHPLNQDRIKRGLNPANSIWVWGEGTKPILPNFYEIYHKKGAMISAVDLLKGIAIAAGMESIDVAGATGNIHTNYAGKVKAALDSLARGNDFVYIHIEAPDECGHQGAVWDKVKAIELVDQKVVGPLVEELTNREIDFKIAVLPDHPTPIRTRTHTSEPVPYLIYCSTAEKTNQFGFSEAESAKSGKVITDGYRFMDYFLHQ